MFIPLCLIALENSSANACALLRKSCSLLSSSVCIFTFSMVTGVLFVLISLCFPVIDVLLSNANCIASIFSFGFGEWAYYVGAASYREYQKYLPNEALFFAFVEYWNDNKIKNIDLVGYREYKMKYSPKIIEVPTIYFERFPGLFFAKKIMKKLISFLRK